MYNIIPILIIFSSLLLTALLGLMVFKNTLLTDKYYDNQDTTHLLSCWILFIISFLTIITFIIYMITRGRFYKSNSWSIFRFVLIMTIILGCLFIVNYIFYGATIKKILDHSDEKDKYYVYVSLILGGFISLLFIIYGVMVLIQEKNKNDKNIDETKNYTWGKDELDDDDDDIWYKSGPEDDLDKDIDWEKFEKATEKVYLPSEMKRDTTRGYVNDNDYINKLQENLNDVAKQLKYLENMLKEKTEEYNRLYLEIKKFR